jgi:peptide/nickel transport system ATP-binding protein
LKFETVLNQIKNTEPKTSTPATVLEVEDLSISYATRCGDVEAVRGVSFTVKEGETMGLVGESGCGKSTIAFGIVNFLGSNGKITSGSIRFQGEALTGRSTSELKEIRGNRIAMVYQDPMQALNPALRIGDQLTEVLTVHQEISREDAFERSVAMLRRVNMPDAGDVMRRYSHQISGGQQQRIVIAMAMLNNPALLIMDEPTTALDVTVEAAVLDLLKDLKEEYRTANIFITHNLGVVARISDRLSVMYAGEMIEQGTVTEIFKDPRHPYTMGLLSCVPKLGQSKSGSYLHPIRGRVPPPAERSVNACIFEPRCPFSDEVCRDGRPDLTRLGDTHSSRCFFAGRITRPEFERELSRKTAQEASGTDVPEDQEILKLDNLRIYYPHESNSVASLFGMGEKRFVRAVDDVSLHLSKSRTLGIVGESGCGKSTLVKGIIGLEPVTDGEIEFMGIDVVQQVSDRDSSLVREMQMVFQNPDSTLNPAYSIGKQIARPIRKFKTVPGHEVREEVLRLLKAVRLGPAYYNRLPHQLSGGEKQRVGIARALASRPDLIICDEPVSALDVSVQAAVINLLLEIQQNFDTAMIFIAHDLSVVRYFSDDIAVMYLGQIVEVGPAEAIYDPPYHPYTEALLSAVPIPDPEVDQKEIRLPGNVPSALSPPKGCRFHPRCPRRAEMLEDGGRICETEVPPWRENRSGHRILCHIPMEKLRKMEEVKKSGRVLENRE